MKRQVSNATILLFSAAALFMAGCQHSYEELRLGPSLHATKLSSQSVVYVAVPADARYKKDLVYNSGQAAAELIRNAFSTHVKRAYAARQAETLDEAITSAQKFRCTYLVFPTLLRWEDHATEFTGIRDKVEVRIEVYDPLTRQLLHAAVLKGASRWMTDGGDTPKDLLREPVAKYAASLFQPIYSPSALP